MKRWPVLVLLVPLLLVTLAWWFWPRSVPGVQVGSKSFTESVVLGEMLTQILQTQGTPAHHQRELGGTRVLWKALLAGDLDLYPEYTGTIAKEILAGEGVTDEAGLRAKLKAQGVWMSRPLGFNNTYALALRPELAQRLGLKTISDLAKHPELRLGFSNEFMSRGDGWPGLKGRYRLPQKDVRGLDHDLAYRSMQSGDLDVTDAYSTDADIRFYRLVLLEDDLAYFPRYDAVVLLRQKLADERPDLVAAIQKLEGNIDAATMTDLNAQVKVDRVPEAETAARYLRDKVGLAAAATTDSAWANFWKYTRQHLGLVGLSLAAAILVALPLGILAFRRPVLGQWILSIVGVIQTIPSLALLVFMIPLLGIGAWPAIVALFLYSLLPIVRNTQTGLAEIPLQLREAAEVLGLPPWARLFRVELPLASRSILGGIKTAAVINVGTATIGALIGAGGYGQPILTGLRLSDTGLILQGAIPAAVLALLVQWAFDGAERFIVSPGLRVKG